MGKGKKRAPVWEHYELSIDGQGKQIAHCKRCRSQLVAEGTDGTTHVKRHLIICTGRQDSAPPDVPAAPAPGAAPESSNCSKAANWEEAATADLARMTSWIRPILCGRQLLQELRAPTEPGFSGAFASGH